MLRNFIMTSDILGMKEREFLRSLSSTEDTLLYLDQGAGEVEYEPVGGKVRRIKIQMWASAE